MNKEQLPRGAAFSAFAGASSRALRSVADHFRHGPSEPVVEYASPYAKMSYETVDALRRLERELPPDDGDELRLEGVRFVEGNREKGHVVLLFTGDFMLSDDEDDELHYVRPRTRRMLDALHVKYRRVHSPAC